jgi:hypothetical protein
VGDTGILESDTLLELRRTLRVQFVAFLTACERRDTYVAVKAGWIHGIKTIDAGLVRGRTVYRIKVWDHSNAAFWIFSAEYQYYRTLPEIKDVVWRTDDEYVDHIDSLRDAYEATKLKIAAIENARAAAD